MRYLSDRLLLCLALAFSAGVLLGAAHPGAAVALAACGAALLVLALAARRRSALGVAVLLLTTFAGAMFYRAEATPQVQTVAVLPEGGQTLIGIVATAPGYRDGVWRFVLAVEGHEEGERIERLGGRCYVQLRARRRVQRGEQWRLTGRLRGVSGERNPGGKSEARRLAGLGVSSVLNVGGEELAQPLGRGTQGRLSRHVCAAQAAALALLERHVGGPYRALTAQLAGSVIFGVHAAPPPAEVSEDFRRAGTIHLLVVSGSMVSMVFGMVFLPGVLGAGWRRRRTDPGVEGRIAGRGRIRSYPGLWAAVIAMGVVVYYAVLTEGGQAVWRAAIMGLLVAFAFALRRLPSVARHHGLNLDACTLLATAGLIVLVLHPGALFAPGFQLTFAAVGTIIYLTPKLQPAAGWMPRWIALAVGGTVAAQLGTFPILAWHYGNAPIAGLAANLLAVPLASVVLTAGIATCALGALAPWVASVPGWITGWATRGLVWVSSAFASLPWAAPEIPRPAWWTMVMWYGGLAALGWGMGRMAERRGAVRT